VATPSSSRIFLAATAICSSEPVAINTTCGTPAELSAST
jgi:hypothetical protein